MSSIPKLERSLLKKIDEDLNYTAPKKKFFSILMKATHADEVSGIILSLKNKKSSIMNGI